MTENVRISIWEGMEGGGNKVENSRVRVGRNRKEKGTMPLSGNGYLGESRRHAGDELVASQPERPRDG